MKDLIHTTAKEWKAAKPVTGSPQGQGSIFNRTDRAEKTGGASRKKPTMPNAEELAAERASGPSGGGEGPSEEQGLAV